MRLPLFLLYNLRAPLAEVGKVDQPDGLRLEEVLGGGALARK